MKQDRNSAIGPMYRVKTHTRHSFKLAIDDPRASGHRRKI